MSRIIRQEYPDIPQIINTEISSAKKVEDVNKFLAIKLLKKNKDYLLAIEDEASQSGLESRGSGSKGAALETRVISLSRKAHCDLILISQMMSMLDKRAQWLANIWVLCEAVWLSDNLTALPDYFEYTIYDSNLVEIGGFELEFIDCVNYVFPHMDTDDIPYLENLKKQWVEWFDITDKDYEEFDSIMEKPLLSVIAK